MLIEQVTFGAPEFSQILTLRKLAYEKTEAGCCEKIDEYSLHFAAFEEDRVVGALRVTCLKDGPLESQENYPNWLLDEFGHKMCAASRMCVLPERQAFSQIPLALTEYGWGVVISKGVRIDVSKARLKAIPFYLKMGYWFIRDSFFSFGKWDALCGLIAYPVHPMHPGQVSHVFREVIDPMDLSLSLNRDKFIDSQREFLTLAKPYREKSHL